MTLRVHWPEERTLLDLGAITLTEPVADNAHEQKYIIFDPDPRVEVRSILPEDPLIELRVTLFDRR